MSAEIENRLRAAFDARTRSVTPDALTKPSTLAEAIDLGPSTQDVTVRVVDDRPARGIRHGRWTAPLLAAASVAVVIAGGYAVTSGLTADRSDDPAVSTPTTGVTPTTGATPTTSATPTVEAVTAASLESAPVPALCGHAAGTLVNGVQTGIPQGEGAGALVSRPGATGASSRMIAVGDLTGDGVADAAAIFNCYAGGVPWPDQLLFYTAGPTLLGSVFLGDFVGDARDATQSITYRNGGIDITTRAATPGEGGCCVYQSASLRFTWNGRAIVASDIAWAGPDAVSFTGVGNVRLGQTAAQLRAVGFGAGQTLANGCTTYERPSGIEPKQSETGLVVTVDPARDAVIAIDAAGHPRGYVSTAGVSVNSTVADVLDAYQGHTIEKHLDHDFGQGSSGLLVAGDGGWIGFTVTEGKVSGIKVGDKAHATNGEAGC